MATEDVQFSTDPQQEAKIRDVIGLCLHPPDNAIVLCVDEKLSSSTSSKSCRAYPQDELRVVLDNYQTHKHADITTWLQDHPRVSLPFTPTSEAWLNLVDIITRQAIRRGSSNNVTELITAIKTFHHRLEPALPPRSSGPGPPSRFCPTPPGNETQTRH